MNRKSLMMLRVFIAFIMLTTMFFQIAAPRVSADSSITVSRTIENNTVSFIVQGATNAKDAISIMVLQKPTNAILYIDQAELVNGAYTFHTLLPKGNYKGYVGSSNGDKVAIEDFTVTSEEIITQLKTLKPIQIAVGGTLVLPSTVIAVYNSGASREIGVQWTNVPDTSTAGQFIATGAVEGFAEQAQITVNVSQSTTPTPSSPPTTVSASTPAPASSAPAVQGNAVYVTATRAETAMITYRILHKL